MPIGLLVRSSTKLAADPMAYGASGDGTVHLLSELYASLAAAQALYPHATALTNSLDWAAWQAAVNAVVRIRSDQQAYAFADGEGVLLRNDIEIEGVGRLQTTISTKDAYAFRTPTSGPMDRVKICGLGSSLRAGAVSGGLLIAQGSSGSPFHSAWHLEELYSDGQTTVTTPLVLVDGFIGSSIRALQTQICQVGLKVDSTGFASNAVNISDFRGVSCSDKAYHVNGGSHVRLRDSTIESNSGYGAYVQGSPSSLISGTWFEDNKLEHVVFDTCQAPKLVECKLHYHSVGSPAGTKHVKFTAPDPSPSSFTAINGVIADCSMVDGTASGYDIEIGAFCGETTIRDTNCGAVLDNGRGTVMDNTPYGHKLPLGDITSQVTFRSTAETPDGAGDSGLAQVLFGDPTSTDYAAFHKTGYVEFRTSSGDPGTIDGAQARQQTKSFVFYYDPADDMIKVRVRKTDGSWYTTTLSVLAAANPIFGSVSVAGAIYLYNNVPLYFKNSAGASGWAIIPTTTLLNFKDQANNLSALQIGNVGAAAGIAFFGLAPVARPTTAGAAAAFVANASGIANDTATFDGYTIGQVVKALRTLGLLT